MKKQILVLGLAGLAGSLLAAETSAKEEVINAAKKLGEQPNYSWKTTVVVPESAQFKPGPIEGKTEKDGFTYLKMSIGENQAEGVIQGDKTAVTNQDGEWQSASELENSEGRGRFRARM